MFGTVDSARTISSTCSSDRISLGLEHGGDLFQVFAGEYQVNIGGHQPGDMLGEATSNVVSGTFKISAEEAHVVPRRDRG